MSKLSSLMAQNNDGRLTDREAALNTINNDYGRQQRLTDRELALNTIDNAALSWVHVRYFPEFRLILTDRAVFVTGAGLYLPTYCVRILTLC